VTITVRTLCLLVALLASAMGAGLTLLLHHRDSEASSPSAAPRLVPDTPTVVSAAELASLSSPEHPIYWAGEVAGRRLEATATRDGTFVRYLPAATRVGEPTKTLTVATYELPDAWNVAQRAARRGDARRHGLADGRVAVWRTGRPTSVYIARPNSTVLVEVFDPDASNARRLSLSGLVQPVAGS